MSTDPNDIPQDDVLQNTNPQNDNPYDIDQMRYTERPGARP